MPSPVDEYRFWDTKLADAHHNMLDTVQASAGKWQTAIAAFLGVYATVGFILTPDKLAALPVRGAAEIGLLAAYVVAGVLGIVAVIQANLASQGIPQVRTGTIGSEDYYQLVKKRAESASLQLLWAMWLAAAAGILVVAALGLPSGSRSDQRKSSHGHRGHPEERVLRRTAEFAWHARAEAANRNDHERPGRFFGYRGQLDVRADLDRGENPGRATPGTGMRGGRTCGWG